MRGECRKKATQLRTSSVQHLSGAVGISALRAWYRQCRHLLLVLLPDHGERLQIAACIAKMHFHLVEWLHLVDRPTRKLKQVTSYLKQQSKHFISIKHVVLVSQWNDEKTFKKTKKSLIPTNSREVFKAI